MVIAYEGWVVRRVLVVPRSQCRSGSFVICGVQMIMNLPGHAIAGVWESWEVGRDLRGFVRSSARDDVIVIASGNLGTKSWEVGSDLRGYGRSPTHDDVVVTASGHLGNGYWLVLSSSS